MSCCAIPIVPSASVTAAEELRLASRTLDADRWQSDISVPTIHCGGCIHTIESELIKMPGVEHVRVNLSAKRVSVRWCGTPPPLLASLRSLGYEAHFCGEDSGGSDGHLMELILALAVAGFSSSNIMMLSVGIWAGAEPATRDIFHGLSALIALPALVFSGRIFFRSAWSAIRHGRTNMDVPISIGVLLAFGLSIYETVEQGAHAYFDAATMLLFFLLIGRTLDYVMRERARVAVKGLAKFAARGAVVIERDGSHSYRPLAEVQPGMAILLVAGERVPVDSIVSEGCSEIDCSLVTGESLPQSASKGTPLQAGTLNLTGALTIVATSAAKESFLAEMLRMMEAAETSRSAYRRIADRVARLYAPVVHLTALLTFIGWMSAGADVHEGVTIAIAVLIITCPCALGLAVPMVQVAAARRLFERGIMVKDGSALERLADIDAIVFDKTGTLTLGRPHLIRTELFEPDALRIASAVASHSRHPYSLALGAMEKKALLQFENVSEQAGFGLEAVVGKTVYRLGRPDWAVDEKSLLPSSVDIALTKDGRPIATFQFDDPFREGVNETMLALRDMGFAVEIVSGDSANAVEKVGTKLDVAHFSRISPVGKVNHVAKASTAGRKVLMVGDGLNDAPALAAAHASMAPASGADVGRNAADLVFLRESLMAVPQAIAIAREANRLIRQNLILAAIYNAVAVPIAVAGAVTPLIAAAAMSLSSVLVVANSMRLRGVTDVVSSIRTSSVFAVPVATERAP